MLGVAAKLPPPATPMLAVLLARLTLALAPVIVLLVVPVIALVAPVIVLAEVPALPIVLIEFAVATPMLSMCASMLLVPFASFALRLFTPFQPVAEMVLDWLAALASMVLLPICALMTAPLLLMIMVVDRVVPPLSKVRSSYIFKPLVTLMPLVRVIDATDSTALLVTFITIAVPPDVPCVALESLLVSTPPMTVVEAELLET